MAAEKISKLTTKVNDLITSHATQITELKEDFELKLANVKKELKKEMEQILETKLTKIEAGYEAKVNILKDMVNVKDDTINKLNRDIGELQNSVNMTGIQVNDVAKKNSELVKRFDIAKKDMSYVTDKAADLEDRMRRQNLIFYNIEEKDNENCEELVNTVLKTSGPLEHGENALPIDRAHRLGRKNEGKTRPLIIRCTYFKDKQGIIFDKRKLAGSGVSMSEDYSKPTLDLHKELYTRCKAAKGSNERIKTFHMKYKFVTVVYDYTENSQPVNFRKNFRIDNMMQNPTDWHRMVGNW